MRSPLLLCLGLLFSACANRTGDTGGGSMPTVIASFDGSKLQLPESVFYYGGMAYLSLLNGSVVRVTPTGTVTDVGNVPIDPPGSAFAEGIAVDAAGNVYVVMAGSSETSTFAAGVYKIPSAGGTGTLYATNPAMKIPQDLDFDAAGNLYVTDGPTGTVFKLSGTTAGTASPWKHDALLDPSPRPAGPCGTRTAPFPIGADSIVVEGNRVVVANLEKGALVAIAIEADGSAGEATSLVTNSDLCGIDGVARHPDGSSYLAVSESQGSLMRIAADGTITTLYKGLPFRTPTGVDVGMFGTARQVIVSSTDFFDAFGDGGLASAKPNLCALPL